MCAEFVDRHILFLNIGIVNFVNYGTFYNVVYGVYTVLIYMRY